MAKRKKHPRLPSGFGSIKYLGKNRRNPYAVYPPTKEFTENGIPVSQPALDYVDDWYYGFSILTAYHAKTFIRGEYPPKPPKSAGNGATDTLVENILADFSRFAGTEKKRPQTFAEVYEQFHDYKFRSNQTRTFSKSAKQAVRSGFRLCQKLHDRVFADLRHDDLQQVVDDCPLKHASLEQIVSLMHQMYVFAEMKEICTTDYSKHVKINKLDDDEHGVPFSDSDLKLLWQHSDNDIVEMILIMCYSGHRISEYTEITINLHDKFFQGGIKTDAGKDRIVPIHSAIYPLVERRLKRDGKILTVTTNHFRRKFHESLDDLKIQTHTPHDCRHTFSRLCEKYKINENDRKRMLGHSFGSDITNSVYGHRSIEDLHGEIEKIQI